MVNFWNYIWEKWWVVDLVYLNDVWVIMVLNLYLNVKLGTFCEANHVASWWSLSNQDTRLNQVLLGSEHKVFYIFLPLYWFCIGSILLEFTCMICTWTRKIDKLGKSRDHKSQYGSWNTLMIHGIPYLNLENSNEGEWLFL